MTDQDAERIVNKLWETSPPTRLCNYGLRSIYKALSFVLTLPIIQGGPQVEN